MKKLTLLTAAAIVFLGTGCASGPGVASLSSYLYAPAEEQMYAEAPPEEMAPQGPQPGDKVVERVVEEVPVERVVRETVVREVPVERVVTEREVIIERPQRVYVTGTWYDPTDVVISHIHGPGCGHYFHAGVWYNDPDLIVVDAYTPRCSYVHYDGLWYPRADIFITTRHYRRRSHVGSVVIWGSGAWPLPWVPTYWHHRRHHGPWWHRDRDVDIDIDINNYGDGGGRSPKTEVDAGGRRLKKSPLMDRRARPKLVNDTVTPETIAKLDDVPKTGLNARPVLGQKPQRGDDGTSIAAPSSGAAIGGKGAQVRSVKATRGSDDVKSRRTTPEVAKRSGTTKDVRSTAAKRSLLSSPRSVYRGARPVSGRAVSRTTARKPFPTESGYKSSRTAPRVPLVAPDTDTRSSRSVRKPSVAGTSRSTEPDRSSTAASPRSTFNRDDSERNKRPVLTTPRRKSTSTVRSDDKDSRRSTTISVPKYTPPSRSVRRPGVIDTERSARSSRSNTTVISPRSNRSSRSTTTTRREVRPTHSVERKPTVRTPSRSTRSLRSLRSTAPSRSTYKAPRSSSSVRRQTTTPSSSSYSTRSSRPSRSSVPSVRSSRTTRSSRPSATSVRSSRSSPSRPSISAPRSAPSRSRSMSSRASSSSARSSARSSGARAARSAR